jgi:hypothetical protein
MKKRSILAGAAAVAVFATAAYAAVTFNPATGDGFVGKGDVQFAFGWNNHALQANGEDVTFYYDSVDTYDAVCTFTTAVGTPGEQVHNVNIPRRAGISSDIEYDARKRNQINGYILRGYNENPQSFGTVPVVGETCVANDNGIARNGTWSSVTPSGSSGGGLYVDHTAHDAVLIWSAD